MNKKFNRQNILTFIYFFSNFTYYDFDDYILNLKSEFLWQLVEDKKIKIGYLKLILIY